MKLLSEFLAWRATQHIDGSGPSEARQVKLHYISICSAVLYWTVRAILRSSTPYYRHHTFQLCHFNTPTGLDRARRGRCGQTILLHYYTLLLYYYTLLLYYYTTGHEVRRVMLLMFYRCSCTDIELVSREIERTIPKKNSGDGKIERSAPEVELNGGK